MLLVGRGWVTREEFWRLPPGEVHWLLAAHIPPDEGGEAGKFDRLHDMLKKAKEEASGV